MKRQGRMTPPKEHNNPAELDTELKDTYGMPDVELKIMIIK